MNMTAEPLARTCASVRARLGLSGTAAWRRLGLVAFSIYLAKGLLWIVIGYIALRR